LGHGLGTLVDSVTRVTKLNNTEIEIDRRTKYRQHTTNASFSWRSVA